MPKSVFQTLVSGVSFKNNDGTSRQEILENTHVGDSVYLEKEPENPYDQNAIKVTTKKGCIGYIPKELAQKLSKREYAFKSGVIGLRILNDNGLYSCTIIIEFSRSVERINDLQLQRIINNHKGWLDNKPKAIKANLSNCNLEKKKLSFTNFTKANFSDANLIGANLQNINMAAANLSDANLSKANLTKANLSGANLSGANLSGANLSQANLSLAELTGADLSNANLSNSILCAARLCWADLSEANLNGADTRATNFTGAKNYTQDD